MDEAGYLVAKIQSSMVVSFMYKMVHTGTLPKFMQKNLDKTDGGKKELYNGFLNMFGIGKCNGMILWNRGTLCRSFKFRLFEDSNYLSDDHTDFAQIIRIRTDCNKRTYNSKG